MEIVLAFVIVAFGLWLARRRSLHPLDYLVAAVVAFLLAAFVFLAIPTQDAEHQMVQHGAPYSERVRSDFLAAHGGRIALALLLCAGGYGVGAIVRRRVTPAPLEPTEGARLTASQ